MALILKYPQRQNIAFSTVLFRLYKKDYESTSSPDPIIEMRDPYEVELTLQSYRIYKQGSQEQPLHTESQIEEILEKNFGTRWRDRYKRF